MATPGFNAQIPDFATGAPFIDLFRKGISVTRWVQNGTSGGKTNLWGYPTVVRSMQKFYRETDELKRDSALAAAFRSLGQVEHLIEDNTVPDHTRDLLHPGAGFEEYLKTRVGPGGPPLLSAFPYAEWKFMLLTAIETEGPRRAKHRRMWVLNPVGAPSPFDGVYWKTVMGIEEAAPAEELLVH